MTREGIIKHRAVFEAWLDGKVIEYSSHSLGEWKAVINPSFVASYDYRVKPEPREFYINVYKNGCRYLYSTKELARDARRSCKDAETIKVREVLE